MNDNYDDVSREGLVDMLQESTDEIQQLRKRLKEFKQVEANYDALQSPMPCGHLARYAVNGDEGTQYCALCVLDATQLTIINLVNEDEQ